MYRLPNELEEQADYSAFLFILPEGQVPKEDVPFVNIKYLHQPSILSTTGADMGFLKNLLASTIELSAEVSLDFGDDQEAVNIENLSRPATFYRYVRPCDWENFGRPGPRGGVCFLVDLKPEDKQFSFSFSICNPKDNFSKRAARKIARQRMDNDDVYVIEKYDPSNSVVDNIYNALTKHMNSATIESDSGPSLKQVSYRAKPDTVKNLRKNLW